MKVIFLDVDGVLNDTGFMARGRNPHPFGEVDYFRYQVNPGLLRALKFIVDETEAIIVLSSIYRRYASHWVAIQEIVKDQGMVIHDKIADYGGARGQLIQEYIEMRNVTQYVILEDDVDEYMPESNTVQTSLKRGGLTWEKAERAIEILNS